MLSRAKAAQALERKRDAFGDSVARTSKNLEYYLAALDEVLKLDSDEIKARLGGVEWPGARPTADLDRSGFVSAFTEHWADAGEARAWALQKLRGVTTVAVDGSQIAASKEFSVPVSLVQIGWFQNPHDPASQYVKDVRNEILGPADPPEEVEEYAFNESRLNRSRFALEMEVAVERIKLLEGSDPPALVFIDGTLVLSFASRMPSEAREVYLQALFQLLDAAETCRVPVVGYVDRSYAVDLTSMVKTVCDLRSAGIFDAQLLLNRMQLFDRTAAFRCARGDILPHYRDGDRDYSEDLCFVYLKTGYDRLPARLDFPIWMLEAGLIDQVVDIVRAEAVIGPGYPYALEAADAAAVLTTEDRMAFYRLWQGFAHEAGIEWALPGKTASKVRRR